LQKISDKGWSGYRTWNEYCDQVFRRTRRAVNYFLAGGNKRRPTWKKENVPQASDWKNNPEDYTTSSNVFDPLDAKFYFTLDAADTKANAKCSDFISPEQDSLKTPWSGVVWLNPPFRDLAKWAQKCVDEQKRGVTTVALFPITNSFWMKDVVLPNAEVQHVFGPVRFGQFKNSYTWPLSICVFRPHKRGNALAFNVGQEKAKKLLSVAAV